MMRVMMKMVSKVVLKMMLKVVSKVVLKMMLYTINKNGIFVDSMKHKLMS